MAEGNVQVDVQTGGLSPAKESPLWPGRSIGDSRADPAGQGDFGIAGGQAPPLLGFVREKVLGRSILRDVSRSFYLTLRVLPAGFREPASIGYLLARISDTISDTERVEVPKRAALLDEFRRLTRGDDDWEPFQQRLTEGFAGHQQHAGEAVLLPRAGDCLDWMRSLEDWKREAVRDVVRHITEGQSWDLTRFEGEGVVRLDRPEELDRYTYLVAGSVGEFWTELGFGIDAGFSRLERNSLRVLGADFGKGLQLVNILRDVSEDAGKGRCYLPGTRPVEEVVPEWCATARAFLCGGLRYAGEIRGVRLRAATGLPALLGLRTLDLVEDAAGRGDSAPVKVSRAEVKRLALLAGRAACSRGPAAWTRLSKIADRGGDGHD